ncbi:ABC transporter substrate-binding protein [Brevibacillus sp. TJ4]|uniref:ABC transporter substrate-binding protein n=1 Tax=Brevibacillus sp. TJ4 TaxID=3234853 RepID=UPI0037D8C81C
MKKPFKQLLVSSLVCALALAACSPAGQQSNTTPNPSETTGGAKGEIVVAVVSEPDSLDVHKTSSIGETTEHLYATLFKRDLDGKIVPNLVKEYEVGDGGKEVTFHLKEGAVFHSGNPINAEAVKKSFERFLENSPFASNAGTITNIEVLGEYSFKLTWEEPYAPFFSNATSAYLAPLDVAAMEGGSDRMPVAAGPLELVEVKRGDSVVYKPFEKYEWGGGEPGFSQVTYRFIPDDETRILEFKRGSVNVLLDVPFQYVEELEKEPGVELERVSDYVMYYLGWNNKLPIFQDVRVREAIALAVDRDPLIQNALRGAGQPVFGPLPAVVNGHNPAIEEKARQKFAQDKEKAKQLLAEAGWNQTNSDGIVMKDGKPFSVEMWVQNEPVMQRVAQILQHQLHEIGIDVKLTVKESAAIIEQTPQGSHQMILWSYGWFDADVMYFLLFGKGRSTRLHYEVDELDEILRKARVEMDPAARQQLYDQAQEYLLEQSPWVPLFVRESITAVRGLENFQKHPISNRIIWDNVKVTE